jgi:hypothetical protein
MKVKEISLTNFAKYDQVTVSFDDNVTYLVGKNGSGKSTLGITAIWFMFQGIAEKASGGNNPLIGERFRFIGPKAATAKGEMILHDEKSGIDIKVMRKLTKSGSDLSFEAPEGYQLDQQWLTDLFNIFLIAPKKFCELSPKDQAKALGIDTKSFDDEISDLKRKYTEINAVYRSFGELQVVEKVENVDVKALQDRKEGVKTRLNNLYLHNKKQNEEALKTWENSCTDLEKEISIFNNKQYALQNTIEQAALFASKLADLGYEGEDVKTWIASLGSPEDTRSFEDYYPPKPVLIEELPDRSELDAIDLQIVEAGKTNENALRYEQYLQKKQDKETHELRLKANKELQAITEQKRVDYIKEFKFPFSNLTVDDDGQLLLAGKPIKDPYFSTAELLKVIPILLSTSNPELKYVFIQGFNDLDEDNWKQVEEYLTGKGFQLVVEMVGKTKVADKNCILLRDNVVIDEYEEVRQPQLV